MPDMCEALSVDRLGILISVEVTAGAREACFPAGYNEWRRAVGCRVTAPALEGKANKAVIRLVADTLNIPTASVSIFSGATSSQKRVLVTGMNLQQVLEKLSHA